MGSSQGFYKMQIAMSSIMATKRNHGKSVVPDIADSGSWMGNITDRHKIKI